jgi:uncharacterized membrane protein
MSTARGTGGVWAWRVLGAVLLLAAAICGAVAAANWEDYAVEGAYLNRSVGAPAYSAVFSTTKYDGGRVMLGVAIGLAVAGVLVLAVSVLVSRARRPSPAAPARAAGRAR